MSESELLFSWWASVEEAVIRGDGAAPAIPKGAPVEVQALAEAAVAEVRFDLDRAQQLLDEIGELQDSWQRVVRLLRLRYYDS